MSRYLALFVLLFANTFAQIPALRNVLPATTEPPGRSLSPKVATDSLGFDPAYKLSLPRPVQDKNFYLLSLFQRKDVRALLSRDQSLQKVSAEKLLALKKTESCKDVACFDALMRLDALTIEAIAATLNTLANHPEFQRLAKTDLRPSGVF